MASIQKNTSIAGKQLTGKMLTNSPPAKGKSKQNQSEVVAKAFAAASKRTGTFASKYAK